MSAYTDAQIEQLTRERDGYKDLAQRAGEERDRLRLEVAQLHQNVQAFVLARPCDSEHCREIHTCGASS